MKVSPVLRVTSSFLQKRSAMSFCFYQPMLDPRKHIYMNHVPHNVYADYWAIGEYPELHLIGSVAAATYQPRAQAIILETLKSRYNVNLTEAEILDQRWDQLFRHTIKTEESHKQFVEALLRRLATGIFVKESKWTWVKEQQIRLNMAGNLIQEQQPQTIGEFLQAYNIAIEQLVVFSHFGFSGNISQAETAQEKHYFQQLNDMPSGIPDLEESRPENSGFINKLMRILHSR